MGDIYTMEDWAHDGSINVKEGQFVEDSVIYQLRDGVPPIKYSSFVFQAGEAEDIDRETGEDLYLTFKRADYGDRLMWQYVGLKPYVRGNRLQESAHRAVKNTLMEMFGR